MPFSLELTPILTESYRSMKRFLANSMKSMPLSCLKALSSPETNASGGIAIYLAMLFDVVHYLTVDVMHQLLQVSIPLFIVGTV